MKPTQELFGRAIDLRIIGVSLATVGALLALFVRSLLHRLGRLVLLTALMGGAAGVFASGRVAWPEWTGTQRAAALCTSGATVSTYASGAAQLVVCSEETGYVLRSGSLAPLLGVTLPNGVSSVPLTRSGTGWKGQVGLTDGAVTVSIEGDELRVKRTGRGAFELTRNLEPIA